MFVSHYASNMGAVYSKLLTQLCLVLALVIQAPYLAHIGFRQAGQMVLLAFLGVASLSTKVLWRTWATLSRNAALANAILHILFLRSEKMVRRVTAMAYIALVANIQTIGNRAISQFIGDTVHILTPIRCARASVTVFIQSGSPQPAFTRGVNMRPKSFGESGKLSGHFVNLLDRLGECRTPDAGRRRGVFSFPDYSIGNT